MKNIFSLKESKKTKLSIIVLVVIFVVAAFFIIARYVSSNHDWIQTKVISSNVLECRIPTNGWSPWMVIKEPTLTKEGETKRTGSGLKYSIDRTIQQYCKPHGCTNLVGTEKTVARGTACSIVEQGVIPKLIAAGPSTRTCVEPEKLAKDGTCAVPAPTPLCADDSHKNIVSNELLDANNLYIDADGKCYEKTVATTCDIGYTRYNGACILVTATTIPKVNVAFECSGNNGGSWNNCNPVVVPNKNQTIRLRAKDITSGQMTWVISDNDTILNPGKSSGKFDEDNKIESINPVITMSYGSGNMFTKKVNFKFLGYSSREGKVVQGEVDQTINIKVSTPDDFKEI